MAQNQTTDLLARLRQHAGPAIMGCTCSSRLPNCPACDCGHAADEIERLRSMIADYSAVPFRCDDCRRKLTVEEIVTSNVKP